VDRRGQDKSAAEKRYQFAMDAKPWPQVLQCSAKSAMANNSELGAGGKLTFIGPKGKTYTLGEILEVLDQALINAKYRLLRSDRPITLSRG